ncbi:MAG TPA: hypothetical protein VM120_26810 [Bryobacteraceae bacterium]|nr:hypothetical protein [Bryobacteraceae bacterium]
MADETAQSNTNSQDKKGGSSVDEVALEMMKFIALTTGFGKPTGATTGFTSGKGAKSSGEEYADALLGLFHRCRETIRK